MSDLVDTGSYERSGPDRKKLRLSRDSEEEEHPDSFTQEYDLETDGVELSFSDHFNGNIDQISNDENDVLVQSAEDTRLSLSTIQSVQNDARTIASIIPHVDVEVLYKKILAKRGDKNRIEIVTNEVLESAETSIINPQHVEPGEPSNLSETLFDDVKQVLQKQPYLDPSYVYSLLEEVQDKPDRVGIVLEQVTINSNVKTSETDVGACGPADSTDKSNNYSRNSMPLDTNNLLNNPDFKQNPLYYDLKTLVKVLPEKDPNELYAYLEAHYDKGNRVQIVIDELTKSESQESLPQMIDSSFEDIEKGKAPQTQEDKVQADLKELKEIFRDCEPNFLYEKLIFLHDDSERVQKIASELFEKREYPKITDDLESKKKVEEKKRITEMNFDMKSFLGKFSDPCTYFDDTERLVNQNYKDHVFVYMKNTYSGLKAGYIKKILTNKNYHLVPAVVEIENYLPYMRGRNKVRQTPRGDILDYPENADEPFFQEVLYYQHMAQIKAHLEEVKRVHQTKLDYARKNGELLECGCCFDDECLFEKMSACADGHLFCKECISRSVEAAVGDGKTKFLCFTENCELEFPLSVLQDVLTPSLFSLALRKIQEEEVRQADIPDLVACPFCSFATIMPDDAGKVFHCLNPECLKESCRLCKEPNHVPLRCEEVEKQGVTSLRTYVETKISEAMLRTCPSCKKRFFKAYGCNKMTCTCGASMCYVCRQPDIDYDHFEQNNGCSIDSDVSELHQKEMMDAAERAMVDYEKEHQDVDIAALNFDLKEIVSAILKTEAGRRGGDDYDSEDADPNDYENSDEDDDDN